MWRWSWRVRHRQRDRQMWADLVDVEPAARPLAELAAQWQAEETQAALREPTMILERGVRVPGYLATEDWE